MLRTDIDVLALAERVPRVKVGREEALVLVEQVPRGDDPRRHVLDARERDAAVVDGEREVGAEVRVSAGRRRIVGSEAGVPGKESKEACAHLLKTMSPGTVAGRQSVSRRVRLTGRRGARALTGHVEPSER